MQVGRNDKCPCGSGKKYKKCCLNSPAKLSAGADLTPAQLVRARATAFNNNDFAFIYDTFHPQSNFCRQFPERNSYIAYGQSTLCNDFKIKACTILEEQVETATALVLFYLKVDYQGTEDEYYELSEFQLLDRCWRYRQSNKLQCCDFSGSIDEITIAHVAKAGICF